MKILIIHPENEFFGGAEKMLGYFLSEIVKLPHQLAVACVPGSKVADLLPPGVVPIHIETCNAFSISVLWKQANRLKRMHADFSFDVAHAWAARGWELAATVRWRCRRPALGTLHDHPHANYISRSRRTLMRQCAKLGLNRVVCVSSAVQNACEETGYIPDKLRTIHNGLPPVATESVQRPHDSFRIGFLGSFSELKGLRDLFRIADLLSRERDLPRWELHLAGGPQGPAGERLLAELHDRYDDQGWCRDIRWHGWVRSPQEFLNGLDLLVVPSRQFDSFPTVLLEAGQLGTPVLASRVGGTAEIVVEGETGWMFEPGDIGGAVEILRGLITAPEMLRRAGESARARISGEFSARKMVAEYVGLYSNLVSDV